MTASPLVPLKAAIASLVSWFEAEGVRGLVIGGVAASILGRPRTTNDVDAMVWLESDKRTKDLLESASGHGFEARIDDALGFALRARVLLLRHVSSGIDVDIALGALEFEREAIAHGQVHDLDGIEVPIPRPEDLVIMKAIAHRPRDTADIESVLDAWPDFDREHVLRVVREFAEALDTPDLADDLDRLLERLDGRR